MAQDFSKWKTPVKNDYSGTSMGKFLQSLAKPSDSGILSKGPEELFSGISSGLQKAATAVKNVGYSDKSEEKKRKFASDMLGKGYSKEAVVEAMRKIDDEGGFQGSWLSNPITGTISSAVAAPLQAGSTFASGLSSVARGSGQIGEGDIATGTANVAKGALRGTMGAVGLATGFTPAGAAVNTAFSSDTASNALRKVSEPIGAGVETAQSALGFDPRSEASTSVREIAQDVVPLAVLGAGQKYVAPKLSEAITGAKGTTKSTQATGKSVGQSMAEKISTKANRFNALDEQKFKDMTGETPGEFAVRRGMNEVGDKAVEKAVEFYKKSMEQADDAFSKIEGKFSTKGSADDVLGDLVNGLKSKMDRQPRNPDLKRSVELFDKYHKEGLTASEINEAKRIYARNHKFTYEQRASDEAVNSTNLQNDLRRWQQKFAEENGFENVSEINKNTQAWKSYADMLAKKLSRSSANNAIGLTDWISLSGGAPTNIALFLGKKALQSEFAKKAAIKTFGKKLKEPIIKAEGSVNQPKNADSGVLPTMSDIGDKPMVEKPVPLLPSPRLPEGAAYPRYDVAGESMRGVNFGKVKTTETGKPSEISSESQGLPQQSGRSLKDFLKGGKKSEFTIGKDEKINTTVKNVGSLGKGKTKTLDELYEFGDDLLNNMAKRVKVVETKLNPGTRGLHTGNDRIYVDLSQTNLNTVLHEFQHFIQTETGGYTGGSAKLFNEYPKLRQSLQKKNYKDSLDIYQEILDGGKTERSKKLIDSLGREKALESARESVSQYENKNGPIDDVDEMRGYIALAGELQARIAGDGGYTDVKNTISIPVKSVKQALANYDVDTLKKIVRDKEARYLKEDFKFYGKYLPKRFGGDVGKAMFDDEFDLSKFIEDKLRTDKDFHRGYRELRKKYLDYASYRDTLDKKMEQQKTTVQPEIERKSVQNEVIDPKVGAQKKKQTFQEKLAEQKATESNRKKSVSGSVKQIKDQYESRKEEIDNFHKNQKLEFTSIPISKFDSISQRPYNPEDAGVKLYKSPVWNGKQSSEYRLGTIDGRLAYFRKSNHWGKFQTSNGVGDERAYTPYEWNLKGGEGGNKSQAGYVFIDDVKDQAKR